VSVVGAGGAIRLRYGVRGTGTWVGWAATVNGNATGGVIYSNLGMTYIAYAKASKLYNSMQWSLDWVSVFDQGSSANFGGNAGRITVARHEALGATLSRNVLRVEMDAADQPGHTGSVVGLPVFWQPDPKLGTISSPSEFSVTFETLNVNGLTNVQFGAGGRFAPRKVGILAEEADFVQGEIGRGESR